MALGKYARVDNRRSASSYCSTVMIVVFVALCLVGVWMMTSSSVVPVENIDIPQENKSDVKPESKNEGKEQVAQPNEGDTRQFEDNPGDLPEDATKGDNNNSSTEVEEKSEERSDEKSKEKTEEKLEDKAEKKIEEKVEEKSEDGSTAKTGDADTKTEDGDSKVENGDSNSEAGGNDEKKSDSDENQNKSDDIDKKSDSDENQNKSDDNDKKTDNDGEEKRENQAEEKLEKNDKTSEVGFGTKSENVKTKNDSSNEVFPSVAQSELLNETTTQNGAWSTQAAESKNEKETQSSSKQQTGYGWKLCNSTAGPDFIPCLDNWKAIRSLHSTKHYEHRERHCPKQGPTCLVPLPDGYRRPVEWPKSREKIWYNNVPHTKLAQLKGHQNWVKVTGKYLTFPGGGTQFKHGALHYIDFIQESVSDIAWGKRSRVILDVGCGVASFGGYLFDRDVLTMSFAPKDEHEAQVQFALERGIPAISAVMGTKRLPFPGIVFDIVHCARCRVPWHIEGGKLLLELNRVLRPGGFFVWSATPVYQKLPEDIGIWKAMNLLTKAMCWDLVSVTKDTVNGVGIAIFKKPDSNECYANRPQNEPPMCPDTDDRNAAWNVPLQACMHKVPNNESERGSQWPEQWPARLDNPPYWLLSSQVGVYGKSAPEDFAADYKHWKRVVDKSYLNGMGVNWALVRNVMDMRSVYGGFAAALKDLSVWVMNVVSIDAPDTLPIIYERGLFGMYHDWCESFSSYPRSYDLLHADHLFSKLKSRCNLVAVFAEVDRLLRPEGKLIVRDNVETISELENMARSLQWEVRMTYSKEKEGLLCVQKSVSRPKELEILKYATL